MNKIKTKTIKLKIYEKIKNHIVFLNSIIILQKKAWKGHYETKHSRIFVFLY